MMRKNEIESQFAAIRHWDPTIKALIDWDQIQAQERAQNTKDGPLAGWSVAVKDIIDLVGLPTRCNANFVPAVPATSNAAIIDQLTANGAFVMAKTVTTTFAHFDPGPTRNPWHTAHTPGGSSSGSAAAVACGMVRLALGSQTIGSVNRPASFCGVVGFKPTYERLSTEGVFPVAPSFDTVGYFTANMADAQEAWAALTGEPARSRPQSLRVGLVMNMQCEPPDGSMMDAVRNVSRKLHDAGHEVKTMTLPSCAERAYEYHLIMMGAETAASHRLLYAQYGGAYTPKLRQLIESGRRVTKQQLRQIASHRQQTMKQIKALFDHCDVLLTPSAPGSAPQGLEFTGDPRMNLLWTYCGIPSLTLPSALDDLGLPLGVQLIGPRMADGALLEAGLAVEALIKFDAKPPTPR